MDRVAAGELPGHVIAALCVATAAAVLGLVIAEQRHAAVARAALKTLASLGFCAVAVAGGAADWGFGRALLGALALSLAGDLLLLGAGALPFLLGLGAFLLAHLAFGAAFVLRGLSPVVVAVAAVALALFGARVGRWLLPHVPARLRAPVVAYIVAIVAMVTLASGSVAAHGEPRLLVAAVAFMVSDLSVARDRFVAPGWINRAWGLPLYYAAQLLFALAAAPPR